MITETFFPPLSSVLTRMHQVPQFKHASLHRATNKRTKESYRPQPFWALPLPCSVIAPHWLVLMKLYFSPLLFPSSPTWKYLFYQRGQIFNYVQNLFFSKTLVGDMRSIISEKKQKQHGQCLCLAKHMLKVMSTAENLHLCPLFSFCLLEDKVGGFWG